MRDFFIVTIGRALKGAGIAVLMLLPLSLFADPPTREVRSYEALKRLIEEKKASSIDQLLPHLDDELRSNYSLVFASESPIGANPQVPRIILSSHDGRFMLSFGGSNQIQNGSRLEIIEQSTTQRRPVPSQIIFSKESSFEKIDYQRNPVSCFGCHSTDKKSAERFNYIMDTYPDWPGWYGTSHNGALYHGPGTPGTSRLLDSPFEERAFERFKAMITPESRYGHLIGLGEKTLSDLAHGNSTLHSKIHGLNAERIAHEVHSSPRYSEGLRRILYPTDLQDHPSGLSELGYKLSAASHRYTEEKLERYLRYNYPDGGAPAITTNVGFMIKGPTVMNFDQAPADLVVRAFLLLEKLGIDPLSVSPVRMKGVYAMAPGQGHFEKDLKSSLELIEREVACRQLLSQE